MKLSTKRLLNEKQIFIVGKSRFLWFLILSYSMVFMLANCFDPRLITVFGLNTGAGALIFPLTYLILDSITEVYGYKFGRLAIWVAFLFNFVTVFYGQIVLHLPAPTALPSNNTFDHIMQLNVRIILFSLLGYLLTEILNSYLVAKFKVSLSGKFIGLRFLFSTLSAHAINLLIFCPGTFYGTMSNKNLLLFTFTSYVFMVAIEIILLPFSIRLSKKLKKIEVIDIYDKKTNFNLFSFDTRYSQQDNEFKK